MPKLFIKLEKNLVSGLSQEKQLKKNWGNKALHLSATESKDFQGFLFQNEIFQLKVNLQLEKGEQMVKYLPNK